MTTGRRPDPIPLKILKGRGNGKDTIGRPIPTPPPFTRAAPDPPDWLDAEARELWLRVAPTLDRLDLLKPEDREAFAAYCAAWSRLADAVRTYQREGLTQTNYETGVSHVHPAVRVAEAASTQLLRFAQQFGLTPAAEVALAKPGPAPSSDDDKFGQSQAI